MAYGENDQTKFYDQLAEQRGYEFPTYGELRQMAEDRAIRQHGRGKYIFDIGPDWAKDTARKEQQGLIKEAMQGEAKEFRKNIPQYTQKQMRGLTEQAGDLGRELRGAVRGSYADRGLINAGQRFDDEAKVETSLTAQLQKQKYDIRREAEDLADAMDETVANTGLEDLQADLAREADAFDLALERAKERRQALAAAGQSIGYGLGYYGYGRPNNQGLIPDGGGQTRAMAGQSYFPSNRTA